MGNLFRANCLVQSNAGKWEWATGNQQRRYPLDEFTQTAQYFRCVGQPASGESGSWDDPLKLQEAYATIEKVLNGALRLIVRAKIQTLDDDVMLTKSSEATKGKGAHVVHNPRKGDGISINVLCDVFYSLICGFTTTKRGGGDQVAAVATNVGVSAGAFQVIDRGFCKLLAVMACRIKRISVLGILDERFAKDRAFTIVESNSHDFEHSEPGQLSIECFPGSGSTTKVARLPTGEYSIATVQTLTGKPKVVNFLLWGKFDPTSFADFVRIPKPLNAAARKECLPEAAKSGDSVAAALYSRLCVNAAAFSLIQQDAAWWTGRSFRLSGSQSNRWARRVLKNYPSRFSLVRTAIGMTLDVTQQTPIGHNSANVGLTGASASTGYETMSFTEAEPALAMTEHMELIGLDASTSANFDETVSLYDEDHDAPDHFQSVNDRFLTQQDPLDDATTVCSILPSDVADLVDEEHATTVDNDEPESASSTSVPSNQVQPQQDITPAQPSGVEPSMSNDFLVQAQFLEDFVVASFVTKFAPSDAMLRGTLTESKALRFLAECFDNKKVYTLGVVHRKDLPHAVASPDGIGWLKGHATGIEAKCSVNYMPAGYEAKTIVDVEVGSREYFERLPHEYLCQFLHEATVIGVNYMLVILSHPTGVSSMTRIHYPDEVLRDYIDYMSCDLFSACFSWFDDNITNTSVSDDEFVRTIPSWATPSTKRILASHVIQMRAVYKYRKDKEAPIEPTHVFREVITDLYNFGKGGTDLECKQAFRLEKGKSLNVPFSQRYAMRLLYFPLLVSLRAIEIWKVVRKRAADWAEISLKTLRQKIGSVPMNDLVIDFGSKLRDSRMPIGTIELGGTREVLPTTPLADAIDVTAAFPNEMRRYLIRRANKTNRQVGQFDFLVGTRIPVSDSSFSPSTPNALIYNPNYISRSRSFQAVFDAMPAANSKRGTRLDYWMAQGAVLRASPIPAHVSITIEKDDIKQRRPRCFWCLDRKLELAMCLFCGEILCKSCWTLFHSMSGAGAKDDGTGAKDDGADAKDDDDDEEPAAESQQEAITLGTWHGVFSTPQPPKRVKSFSGAASIDEEEL